IERGWGRFPAFLYGWTYMLVVDPASSAALVVVLGEFLSQLLGIGPEAGRLAGIGVTLALFAMSLAGIRVGSRVQDALTYTKLLLLVGVGLLAFVLLPAAEPDTHPAAAASSGSGNSSDSTSPPSGAVTSSSGAPTRSSESSSTSTGGTSSPSEISS